MSISKQIGWSNEANLLYEIEKEIKRLQAITSNIVGGNATIGDVTSNSQNIATEATAAAIKTDLDKFTFNAGNDLNVSLATAQVTPLKTTITGNTTIAAGAYSVTMITSSDFTGTILGDNTEADAAFTYSAPLGFTLNAIAITVTAGSVTILKTV